jgi:hypothetical protein
MFWKSLKQGYLVVPLPERVLKGLGRIAHRKTRVASGKKTETHTHKLFSFYIAEKMKALQTPSGDLELPDRALVVVLPQVLHGWTNEKGETDRSFVYDLTPMHAPHAIH